MRYCSCTHVHLQGTSRVNVALPVSVQLISLAAMHQTRARPSLVHPASCCVLGSIWPLAGSGHMNWPIIWSSLQSTLIWWVSLAKKKRRSSSTGNMGGVLFGHFGWTGGGGVLLAGALSRGYYLLSFSIPVSMFCLLQFAGAGSKIVVVF